MKNYYVLGADNTSVFDHYSSLYKEKLEEKYVFLENNSQGTFFLSAYKEKLTHPQISSILHYLYDIALESPQEFLKQSEKFQGFILPQLASDIVRTDIALSQKDYNPYNNFDAHPDAHLNKAYIGYGDRSREEWFIVFGKAFSLLKKIDYKLFKEINKNIEQIVPLGTAENVHHSGTYSNCIGQLYLGYTTNLKQPEVQILEAIIHESSHNKLNMLMQFDPVLECSGEEKYYSAIRPDARPIRGVFIGYHAFVPTMYIVMNAYIQGGVDNNDEWLSKITLYYLKTKFLQKVIKKHAKFTDIGNEIDNELDHVIGLCDVLFKKIGPSKDHILDAKKKQKEHFSEVNQRYATLHY